MTTQSSVWQQKKKLMAAVVHDITNSNVKKKKNKEQLYTAHTHVRTQNINRSCEENVWRRNAVINEGVHFCLISSLFEGFSTN